MDAMDVWPVERYTFWALVVWEHEESGELDGYPHGIPDPIRIRTLSDSGKEGPIEHHCLRPISTKNQKQPASVRQLLGNK